MHLLKNTTLVKITTNIIVLFLFVLASSFTLEDSSLYRGKGSVEFVSEAPLERISASSDQLIGIIDLTKRTFAYTFSVSSFIGFNSPLQREHFNEHYLESSKYPKAVFTGKIIGWKDCTGACAQDVLAKGKLEIHGVTQIVNIPVALQYNNTTMSASATFDLVLEDFDISIPLILEAKISPIINVKVDIEFNQSDE